jgi:hypothetical protein
MHRRGFVASAASAGVAAVMGPAGVRAQQFVWEDVASADGRYRLKMPKGYRYMTVPAHNGVLHSYVSILSDRFILEFLDVLLVGVQSKITRESAQEPSSRADAAAGLQKSWPGSTLVEQRWITLGPAYGYEFVFSTDQGSRFVLARMYLTLTASYTQIAQGPTADRQNPITSQFLDALQFG